MAAQMAALLAAAALVLALSVEPAHAYAPAKLPAHMLRPNGASATPRSCSVSLPVCANWLAPASGSRRCKPVAQSMAAGATWEGKPVPLPDQDEVLAGPTVLRRVWVTDAPGNLRSLKQETELLPPPGPGDGHAHRHHYWDGNSPPGAWLPAGAGLRHHRYGYGWVPDRLA